MRNRVVTAVAVMIVVCACDPVYSIGARVRIAPPAPDSCVLASVRESFSRGPLEAIGLRPDPHYSITVPIRFPLTVPDSVEWWWRNSQLTIEPQKDSTLLLAVRTQWLGTSQGVPIVEQRRYIAAASSALEQVRTACAPQSSHQVECVARGLGGHPACGGGP